MRRVTLPGRAVMPGRIMRTGRIMLAALAATVTVGVTACQRDPGSSLGSDVSPAPTAELVGANETSPSPSVTPSLPPSPASSPTESAKPSPAPSKSVTPSKSPTKRKTSDCPTGEHQKQVEAALKTLGGYGTVTVDGVQSSADCAAIKKFQKRFDIRPAYGRAGPLTADVARRLLASKPSRCHATDALTACVDLTNQTVWIMNGGKVVYGPTVTRTGMAGWATPPGKYSIHDKAMRSWSYDFDVWLPYWQRIVRGIGFHQTTTYLHNMGIGSHGCVNLLPADAVKFYQTLKSGTRVNVFGRRPGT